MVTLAHPFPGASITTRYGSPNAVNGAPHTGTDYAYPGGSCGRLVRAAAAGVVRHAENVGGGHGIEIDHGGGIVTGYWHLSQRLAANGARVSAGQAIATAGASGTLVTGCHLHFELKVGGRHQDPAPAVGGTVAPATVDYTPTDYALGRPPTGYGPDPGKRAKDAEGRDYFPNVYCDPGFIARPAGQARVRCFPSGQGPGPVDAALGASGEALAELGGPLLSIGLNVGVILLALFIGWAGVKQVLGLSGGPSVVNVLARR
jgi:hypothetical protein